MAILLYPNPANQFISFEAPRQIQQIEILDILGQSISKIEANSTKVNYSTNKIVEGVYFANINIDGNIYVKKFEVMH